MLKETKKIKRFKTRKEKREDTKKCLKHVINEIKDQETDFFIIVTDEITAIVGGPKEAEKGLSLIIASLRKMGIPKSIIDKAIDVGNELYKAKESDDDEDEEDCDDNEISKEDIEKIKAFCDMLFGDNEDE